ncbi:MAG: methyltransferase domain-containing protein [Acidimicrobiia bacterium]|nr:methyltransferase domain-containing protein [Acidimicrobiia bacterium]MYC57373.1 methyltransferase domain-containing protein [Acidimicrobiia bacterium]MYI31141.1 methyltransferase domain-containing protein [Acidimicrobiia bacterium]
MREYWHARGLTWVRNQKRLDMMLAPLGEAAIARLHPNPGEVVLDVGCGTGTTAIELARLVGSTGRVTGIDFSSPMITEAQQRVVAAGLSNVDFVTADASNHPFKPHYYDAVFSRMGVMFFTEPVVGFTNLRRAMRAGGRLSFVCWRAADHNSWTTEPLQALAEVLGTVDPVMPGVPGTFALADADHIISILTTAGLMNIDITSHKLPLNLGQGTTDEFVSYYLDMLGGAYIPQNVEIRVLGRIKAALAAMVERKRTAEGITMGGAVWLVSARA